MQRNASRVLSLSFGFSLIEVLISTIILSIALLALARLQIISVRIVNATFLHSVAHTKIQSTKEREMVVGDERVR
jgi:prepilin-type N-terminal cleavage/methylation domain-containing protein